MRILKSGSTGLSDHRFGALSGMVFETLVVALLTLPIAEDAYAAAKVFRLRTGVNAIEVPGKVVGGTLWLRGTTSQFTSVAISLDGTRLGFLACCGIGEPSQCRGDGAFSGTKVLEFGLRAVPFGEADSSIGCRSVDLADLLSKGSHSVLLELWGGTLDGELRLDCEIETSVHTFSFHTGVNQISVSGVPKAGKLRVTGSTSQFTAIAVTVNGVRLGFLACCGVGQPSQCRGEGSFSGRKTLEYEIRSVPFGESDSTVGCRQVDLTQVLKRGTNEILLELWDGTIDGQLQVAL